MLNSITHFCYHAAPEITLDGYSCVVKIVHALITFLEQTYKRESHSRPTILRSSYSLCLCLESDNVAFGRELTLFESSYPTTKIGGEYYILFLYPWKCIYNLFHGGGDGATRTIFEIMMNVSLVRKSHVYDHP